MMISACTSAGLSSVLGEVRAPNLGVRKTRTNPHAVVRAQGSRGKESPGFKPSGCLRSPTGRSLAALVRCCAEPARILRISRSAVLISPGAPVASMAYVCALASMPCCRPNAGRDLHPRLVELSEASEAGGIEGRAKSQRPNLAVVGLSLIHI